MNKFENELKNGKFVCSKCIDCNRLVWPPSDFCDVCFSKVIWREVSKNGKLVEFAKKNDLIFCIAEFENTIRIMGELEAGLKTPSVGQDLHLEKCNYTDKEEFFFRLK